MDTKKRSIAKSVTWRILGIIILWILSWILTRDIAQTAILTIVFHIVRFMLYYFHERSWEKVSWGTMKGKVLWLTGLPSSGKTTIAVKLEDILRKKNIDVVRLDGDVMRSIFPNTGFSKEDRTNHIKKVGYIASLLEKRGAIVICSFVSPYKESRDFVRKLCATFVEIHAYCSIGTCIERDVKGLYKKALAGKIKQFTGISDPYEDPEHPELTLYTGISSVDACVAKVMDYINKDL